MLSVLEKYYPPGYEYKKELQTALLLLGVGIGLSFRFFIRLYNAAEALYEYRDDEKVLTEGAVAETFTQLVSEHWMFFVPVFLFLTAMMAYHYFYYFHDTKSIYVMRRLPKPGIIAKSCVQGPLLCIGAMAVFVPALHLLYYGMYLLAIPADCLPRTLSR